MSARPLAGVQILTAEQMIALPHATQLLALLGAEVIKVEPLGGDAGRQGRPQIEEQDGSKTGSTFVRNNLAKSTLCIDLKQPRGRELFLELACGVDAVAENFRPGAAAKLGIGYEDVRARNAAAIYVSISGFGHRPGPYRERSAYAPVVEAMAGLYEYARENDGPPRLSSAGALGDTGPALYAVIGLLSALHARGSTGVGCHVDVSMYDAMVAIADVVHLASVGVDPSRATRGIGILDSFRAADGWFTIEVVREPHFPQFCEAVGHPEWTRDARLETRSGWAEHLDSVIRPGVEAWASDKTKHEASAALARYGVAAGPVNTAAEITSDAHVRDRGLIYPFDVPGRAAPVDIVGNPIHFSVPSDSASPGQSAEPTQTPARWPVLGQHTDRVLQDRLGLDAEEIEGLRAEGIVA